MAQTSNSRTKTGNFGETKTIARVQRSRINTTFVGFYDIKGIGRKKKIYMYLEVTRVNNYLSVMKRAELRG